MIVTTDKTEIKEWIKKHKGKPEILNGRPNDDNVGLRIDFPGELDDLYLSDDHPPEDTTWDRFFRVFEEQNLAFEYEDKETVVDPSSAFHFIKRDIAANEE